MYCRQCHKQKGPDHFDLYPDHANTGPKVSLARRRELLRQEGAGSGETSSAYASSAHASRGARRTAASRSVDMEAASADGEGMTGRDWLALGGLLAAVGAVLVAPVALAYRFAGASQ